MFRLLESNCLEVDTKMAAIFAKDGGEANEEFGIYVDKLKRRELLQGKVDFFRVSEDNFVDIDAYNDALNGSDVEIEKKQEAISEMEEDLKNLKGVGPCTSSLDATVKMIGVQRQAYHSNSFVGNDCHTLLKEEYIEILCNSIPEIVESFDLGDNELLFECKEQCDKFITLFKKYSACHAIFNSARYLSDDEIASPEVSIVEFLFHLRMN